MRLLRKLKTLKKCAAFAGHSLHAHRAAILGGMTDHCEQLVSA